MKKFCEITTVILFCVIIAIFSVTFLILPDKEFSQQENRNLATLPLLNGERFFSGAFGKDINLYFADQFPLRNQFVKLKSGAELALMKKENNGVLYSKNQLAVKDFDACKSVRETVEGTDYYFNDSATLQLENLNRLGTALEIPLFSVIPPRTIDVTDSAFDYDRPQGDLIFHTMENSLTDAGYINTLTELRSRYEQGEYVYYRTDHHWTTLGAYYTYRNIMTELGKEKEIIPKEDFEIEEITDFSGTTAAKGNFPIYQKDTLEIWHLSNENDFEITADGEALNGFYRRSYLDTGDKYSVFLDGTHNITQITKKGDENREKLIIFKDSFANCLIPFLAQEYDIVALNIHVFNDITGLAEQFDADAVLVVCNTENLITTVDLGKLK